MNKVTEIFVLRLSTLAAGLFLSAAVLAGGIVSTDKDGSESLHVTPETDARISLSPKHEPDLIQDRLFRFELLGSYSGKGSEPTETGGKKKIWRALAETGLFLACNHVRYKQTHSIWVEGVHKYRATFKDQKEKYFNGKNWNYDANCFALNWQHALAGGIYYNFSRTNHLTIWESLIWSWACSTYWEAMVEYRSDVSLNDHIFTPLGGFSVGEAWYQLGDFFSRGSGLLSRVLTFLNPILKINRFFDGNGEKNRSLSPPPGWHDVHLDLGMRRIREGNAAGSNYFHAGLHTQIIHVPDYGATGRIRRFVTSPLFSEIQLDLSWKRGPLEESNFFSRVVYLGYIHQNINNNGRGYSLMLGLGSAFSMYKKKEGTTNLPCTFKGRDLSALDLEKPRDFGDKLSAVHIAGPVLDWTRIRAGYKARLVLDGYLDFGMVNALAFNRYSRSCDISGVKTPLLVNGYYYGFGVTTSSRLNIDIGNFGVEGYLRFQSYGSIDGRDRFQDDVTDDFHLSDSMRVWRIGAVYRIPECPLSLLAGYEGIIRKGIIKNIRESRRELRGFLGLSFVY